MSTLHQLYEDITDVWEALSEGWRRLYRRASNAIIQFTPGAKAGREGKTATYELAARSAGWGVLAAEVFDDGEKVIVRLEAPGLEKRDFDLKVQNHHLFVRGEKRVERHHSEGRYSLSECAYGCFERVIPLPNEVYSSKARAKYENGVLRVELPKRAVRPRRTIKVDTTELS